MTEPSEKDHSSNLLGLIQSFLTDPVAPEPQADPDPPLDPFELAAATQHVYRLSDHQEMETPDSVRSRLSVRSVSAPDDMGSVLARQPRRRILERLGWEGIREALHSYPPRLPTPTDQMFRALVDERPIDLFALSGASLQGLREAMSWLDGILPLPVSESQLAEAERRRAVWARMEPLLANRFVGRDAIRTRLDAFARRADQADTAPLMVIEGVGGIGKSALLAHWLNDGLDRNAAPCVPFAYMPCDDATFDVTRPEVVLDAAGRQLVQHYPKGTMPDSVSVAYERFMSHLEMAKDTSGPIWEYGASVRSSTRAMRLAREGQAEIARAFGRFVQAVAEDWGADRTVVLIIDTFEEVSYRRSTELSSLWLTLSHMFRAAPAVRVILAGRGPIDMAGSSLRHETHELKELSMDAAKSLLSAEAQMEDAQLERVVRQIGRNPLNLRLAARLLADEEPGMFGIKGIRTHSFMVYRLSDELIRGHLYMRIIDHIHAPLVRQLARPAMVLRRITPLIIQQVLIPLSTIELSSVSEDLSDLFAALAKEHTLVSQSADDSLVFREDVRRPAFELIQQEEPNLVRRVHLAALDYYETALRDAESRPDPMLAAEAIYHGMMSGADPAALDRLWVDEIGAGLDGTITEIPVDAKLWLSSKRRIKLSTADYEAAKDIEWERVTGPDILNLMETRGPKAALARLAKRATRTAHSPLIALEARCYLALDEPQKAIDLLSAELDKVAVGDNPGRRAEQLWLLAMAYRQAENPAQALLHLEEVASLADSVLDRPLPRAQALAEMVELAGPSHPGVRAMQNHLVIALSRCTRDELRLDSDVARFALRKCPQDSVTRLPLCALEVAYALSQGVDLRGTVFPDTQHFREIDALARARAKSATGQAVLDIAKDDTLRPEIIAERVAQPLALAAHGENVDEAELRMACRMVWHLAQCDTLTLDTATLGGIDSYRADWELANHPAQAYDTAESAL